MAIRSILCLVLLPLLGACDLATPLASRDGGPSPQQTGLDAGDSGAVDPTPDVHEAAADAEAAADVTPSPDAAAPPDVGAPDVPLPTDPWEGQPTGVEASFTYDPSDLFALPFPTDVRRIEGGGLDLSGFPNPYGSELIGTYVSFCEDNLDGFSANGAVYVAFDGPLDLSQLPTPAESLDSGSTLQLVDVTPGTLDVGRRIPVEWSFHVGAGSAYMPQNLLMVRPVYGFPLREGGTYALLVLRPQRGADGLLLGVPAALRDALSPGADASDDPIARSLAPLRAHVREGAVNPYDIAAATVFTVATMTDELLAVRAAIDKLGPPAAKGVHRTKEGPGYTVYEGTYVAPNFQHGVKPYETEGGGFAFDSEGRALASHMETLRFALSVPDGPAPPTGWPIVLFGHGTGGHYKNFLGSPPLSPAKVLAERGVAVIGIDQPLHGIRWDGDKSQLDFLSFNFLNVDAGRANFRQAAVDFHSLSRLVRETLEVPASESATGEPIVFDPSRVFYFGHSHGGLAGAMIVAIEPDLRGSILSGAGGGLAMTIMLRKDPFDILAVVRQLISAGPDELSTFHPVITLVQTVVDITDPINYAPYFTSGRLRGGSPTHLLVTEGDQDQATPPVTTEAMAAAAGLPVLSPSVHLDTGLVLSGAPVVDLPVSGNVASESGQPATALLAQFAGWDHFVVFDHEPAAQLYARLVESASYGPVGVLDLP